MVDFYDPADGALPAPMPFLSPQGVPGDCPGGLPTLGSTTIITCTYDPLGHLTAADYSSGACFRYAYDAVGNRTVQTRTITSTQVITYV